MNSEKFPTISAILITKNESLNIDACVKSVSFCDEIVVVDNGSTDNTALKARELGCRVVETSDWPGYGVQKQRAAGYATSEWILSIDADERITSELQNEILEVVRNTNIDGCFIKRKSFFLDRWMNFGGWYPDYVLRLARREKCKFDPCVVHEKMIVNGSLKRLKCPLLHYAYLSIEDVLEKQKTYALLGALKIRRKHPKGAGILAAVGHSLWTFFRLYVLQLGVLDGRPGFISATAKAQESFWKYVASGYQLRKSNH